MSDGSISENKISITLNEKEHIEKIKNIINPDRKIYSYKNSNTFMYTNKEDLEFLKSMGVTTNKSYDAKFLLFEDKIMPHYLRGWFDGDGCIYDSYTKNNGKEYLYQFVRITSGSLLAIKQMSKYLFSVGIYNTVTKDCRKDTFYLNIQRKADVDKFKNFIYNEATIYLNRKYCKFMK